MGKLRLDDLHGEKSWGAWQSYGTSKLANIVFTRELARRLEGSGVTATCCHPGFVASNFGETNGTLWDRLIGISKIFAISPPKGALTQTWLAASPEVAGQTGGYYASRKLRTPTVQGRDDAVARELWSLSEKLVGLA
jgi:NAD(P)-dependent dehydrogenase (short-subunit alcohol dehydrogenase family)